MAHTVTRRFRDNHPGTSRSRPMVAAFAVAILLRSVSVSADLHTVTELTDGNDGTCDSHCTLREAIAAANSGPDVDFIELPEGTLLLTDSDGPLHIYTSVSLSGQGQEVTIIDASALGNRAFDINAPGNTMTLTGLTITGGSAPFGGGVMHWAGHLILSDIGIRDNSAAGSGGGISSGAAQLTVKDGSVITRNQASLSFDGGGISGQDVTVIDSVISHNVAGGGGGVSVFGTLTISRSTIADNVAVGFDGGGIAFSGPAGDISNTTIVRNTSSRRGGAVFADGPLSLNAVTIHRNHSPLSADLFASGSAITVTNTLISGDCATESFGSFTSNGGNLESPSDTCGLTPALDLISVADPMLWGPSDFGGGTPTLLPKPGSPAVGAGSQVHCLSEDQRTMLRNDGACDIGAVERQDLEYHSIFVDGFDSGTIDAWQ